MIFYDGKIPNNTQAQVATTAAPNKNGAANF
jgi:hypothetical protein